MCGRYTLATPVAELSRIFGFPELPNLAPRYNIAPTQDIAAVRLLPEEERRELVLMRWGLVPYWADDPSIGSRMINARSEFGRGKAGLPQRLRPAALSGPGGWLL